MIIVDTNVISELMRPRPNPGVEAWARRLGRNEAFTTAVSEAEVRYGIAILPAGERRNRLARGAERLLGTVFAERILPFDRLAAAEFADIAAQRRGAGRPISIFDGQIAAIARCHCAAVATRNTGDFANCGIEVMDPWNNP